MPETWQTLDANREIKILHEGKLVVIKLKGIIVPLFCGVCNTPMRTLEDGLSFRKHECCHWCALEWADSEFYDWENGWRPTKEKIQEVLETRKSTILKPILFT